MKISLSILSALVLGLAACSAASSNATRPSGAKLSIGRSAPAEPRQIPDSIVKRAGPTDATALKTQMSYYDGATKRTIWLSPELVAEFQPTETGKSALLSASPSGEEVPVQQAAVRVWRVRSSTDSDTLTRTLNGGSAGRHFSPVFHDFGSSASPMRSLPGGVIVTFDPRWDRARIYDFAARQNLAVERELLPGQNVFLLSTAPGLDSLAAANRLHDSGEVLSATPNWWKEAGTR